jgi:glycosyltransferase involved in cell wall biosynthesis
MAFNNKVFAFGKFLLSAVGGAEKSTYKILESWQEGGADVCLIGFKGLAMFGAGQLKLKDGRFKVLEIEGMTELKRFSYLEYCLNRAGLKKFFMHLEPSKKMITYGTYAPICAVTYDGDVCIYPRCEYDLGIVNNYFSGLRKYMKYLYIWIEMPFIRIFRADLKKALHQNNVTVVANSKYMKRRIEVLFKLRNVTIEYPKVDRDSLRQELQNVADDHPKGIVFVGDNHLKGLGLVLSIARKIPEEPFFIFCRMPPETVPVNVICKSWLSSAQMYAYAKLVIVPSQWEEAYGRVAREAFVLGIPVLVSERGGLPEAVDESSACVVKAYHDVNAWVFKIKSFLSHKKNYAQANL